MSTIYIGGYSLISCLGADLKATLQNLSPPKPEFRKIKGLDEVVPYFPIRSYSESDDWYQRCAFLTNRAVTDTGTPNKNGALYFASSSCHLGALEKGQGNAISVVEFLTKVAQMLDWKGPVYWVNTACTSSINAILLAQEAINSNLVQDALVLGFEMNNQLTLSGFASMQLLSFKKATSFPHKQDGMVLGESVAALYLTNQPKRWQILGGAHIIDSKEVSSASRTAYKKMLQMTIAIAQFNAEQVDLIKVQTIGNQRSDAVEADVLCDFFTSRAFGPALLSFKSILGHTLGASGAAEIALLLALVEQKKKLNLLLNDVICNSALDINLTHKLPPIVRRLLICNLGFGGSHCCIALQDTESDSVC